MLLRHQLLEAIQAEMQKPEDQRDAALIEECLETIEYLNDECRTPVYIDPQKRNRKGTRPAFVLVGGRCVFCCGFFLCGNRSGFRLWDQCVAVPSIGIPDFCKSTTFPLGSL